MTRRPIPEWIGQPEPGMPHPAIQYFNDRETICMVTYYDHRLKTHRTDGPAQILWHPNGLKRRELWAVKGSTHREDGPAVTEWYENGQKAIERWLFNGELHRDGNYDAIRQWYPDGTIQYQARYRHGDQQLD